MGEFFSVPAKKKLDLALLLLDCLDPEDWSIKLIDEITEDGVVYFLRREGGALNRLYIQIIPILWRNGTYTMALINEKDCPVDLYLNCPESILSQSEVSDDSGWREACRKHQAA